MPNVDITNSRLDAKLGANVKPGVREYLAGDADTMVRFLGPVLPSDLVAGSVPHIVGAEEETVWNAAVQACGTEHVHFCYTIEDGKCWYLATPSASLASAPHSWCPLAAALPGNSEYWDKETVYLYEQDGHAGALRWDTDTGRMQLFLGPARTILPRIQSMDANFVSVNAATANVVPWINRDLKVEQMSRAAGRVLLYSGMVVTMVALGSLLITYFMAALLQPKLDNARSDTQTASTNLMQNASRVLENDTVRHFGRLQVLLDELYTIKGTLVKYDVKAGGRVEWEALVPAAYSSGGATALGNVRVKGGVEKDGRVRVYGTY